MTNPAAVHVLSSCYRTGPLSRAYPGPKRRPRPSPLQSTGLAAGGSRRFWPTREGCTGRGASDQPNECSQDDKEGFHPAVLHAPRDRGAGGRTGDQTEDGTANRTGRIKEWFPSKCSASTVGGAVL